MSIFYIIAGFLLLVAGGDFLVKSSVGLSFKFNLSKLIIGMTVVSFATSAPELIVSLKAALNGSTDMALSNVIGSNVANIALVLGLTAMVSVIFVDKSFYRLNWPAMVFFSVLLFWFLKNDLFLSRAEGVILFVLLIIFIYYMIWDARKNKTETVTNLDDDIDDDLEKASYKKIFIWLVIGAAALYFGSEFLVKGAKEIARNLQISEGVIGLTVVAIGTSVPELAASLIAALKGEKAISLGNLIGSNIFNIGSVLGLTAIINPLKVNSKILESDIYWMLGVALILLPLSFLPKRHKLSRYKGLLLFVAYILFIYLAFKSGTAS
ncbi:MAG TPA: calcium/sodium antiporter [Flavobacteriaceae bacterium]|nr:calcium/sodium antiporter [Flavobacteriaceae bacterium]